MGAVRRYGICRGHEWISVISISLVFGFIFSFRNWGGETYDPVYGIYTWLLNALFVMVSILVMLFGYKFMAYEMGYNVEYKSWKLGLGLNLLLCFLTNGFFYFLTPGGYEVKPNRGMEVGKMESGVLYRELAYLTFWSFFALMIYITLVKLIFPWKLANAITSVSFAVMLWSLLPIDILFKIWLPKIPNTNGTALFFGPKSFAVFVLVFIGFSAVLNSLFTAFWPLLVSLILSFIVYLVYYLFFDPKRLL